MGVDAVGLGGEAAGLGGEAAGLGGEASSALGCAGSSLDAPESSLVRGRTGMSSREAKASLDGLIILTPSELANGSSSRGTPTGAANSADWLGFFAGVPGETGVDGRDFVSL
jgi:hypothetical protein